MTRDSPRRWPTNLPCGPKQRHGRIAGYTRFAPTDPNMKMPTDTSATPDTATVIIVGSYVQDHVWQTDRFPQPGETRRATGFSTGPGGKGFNQAVACVRQHAKALFIGALGNDALAESARSFALSEKLECAWLILDQVPTAAAGIIVNDDGANQIMVNLAANEHLSPDFLLAHGARFAEARVLLVQLENNLEAVRTALKLGSDHGLLRVLNPAPMHTGIDTAMLSLCDLITPNETEFAQLVERFCAIPLKADEVATMANAKLHALCRDLGVPSVVITLGAAGCFVSHAADTLRGDSRDHYRLAAEKIVAVDTTGAGDSFNGALVATLSLSTQIPFANAVVYANRVAAMSTERSGAASAVPHRDEVIARFGD